MYLNGPFIAACAGYFALLWILMPHLRGEGLPSMLLFWSITIGYIWAASNYLRARKTAEVLKAPLGPGEREAENIRTRGLAALLSHIMARDLHRGTAISGNPSVNVGLETWGQRRIALPILFVRKTASDCNVFQNLMDVFPPEAVTVRTERIQTIVVIQGGRLDPATTSVNNYSYDGWTDIFFVNAQDLSVTFCWRHWYNYEERWGTHPSYPHMEPEITLNQWRIENFVTIISHTDGFPPRLRDQLRDGNQHGADENNVEPAETRADRTVSRSDLSDAQLALEAVLRSTLELLDEATVGGTIELAYDSLTDGALKAERYDLVVSERAQVADFILAEEPEKMSRASALMHRDNLRSMCAESARLPGKMLSPRAATAHRQYLELFFPREHDDAVAGLPMIWRAGAHPQITDPF